MDCGSHGVCMGGSCRCEEGWTGPACNQRACHPRCAEHGTCKDGKCECSQGWNGEHCTIGRPTRLLASYLLHFLFCAWDQTQTKLAMIDKPSVTRLHPLPVNASPCPPSTAKEVKFLEVFLLGRNSPLQIFFNFLIRKRVVLLLSTVYILQC